MALDSRTSHLKAALFLNSDRQTKGVVEQMIIKSGHPLF